MTVRGATRVRYKGAPSHDMRTSSDGEVHTILRRAVERVPAAPDKAALVFHAALARRSLFHAGLNVASSTSPSHSALIHVPMALITRFFSGSHLPSSLDAVVRICAIAVAGG